VADVSSRRPSLGAGLPSPRTLHHVLAVRDVESVERIAEGDERLFPDRPFFRPGDGDMLLVGETVSPVEPLEEGGDASLRAWLVAHDAICCHRDTIHAVGLAKGYVADAHTLAQGEEPRGVDSPGLPRPAVDGHTSDAALHLPPRLT
jgi:hypothetical protein